VNAARAGNQASVIIEPFALARPILHALDPEDAHAVTLRLLELGLVPRQPAVDRPALATSLFGTPVGHPIGLAAGFDKNARVYGAMYAQGFAFVEIGGVTPLPQAGNPRPRVFRLPEDGAVINRMGFPNAGADVVEARLRARPAPGPLGINLASNAQSADPIADFTGLVRRFTPYAQYLTLDISCPNTENGQLFLDPVRLRALLGAVNAVRGDAAIVAKLAPDIDGDRADGLVDELVAAGIDGIVVSNTTLARPELRGHAAGERGGLSGPPLFAASTALLARVYRRSDGRVPLAGVGGITSGADAYAKIRAGASTLQLYTALIYGGTAIVTQIKRELAALLARDGLTLEQAVGRDAHTPAAAGRK
jgi:dihydroorotate dehydrogenase